MAKEIKKILIVDDDDFLVDIYASKFREAGFDVEVAFGGDEGIEKLRNGFRPDVLSLDLIMPRKNGFETLSAIRKEGLMKNGITVIVTNASDKHDIQKAMRMGVDGYLVKINHTPSEIIRRVEELLKK